MPESKTPKPGYAVEYIKGDWDRAVYTDSPHTDNLVSVVLALGAELWTLRRRVKVLEHFLDENKVAVAAAVEAYEPTQAQRDLWDKERDAYISRIYDVLQRPTGKIPTVLPQGRVPPNQK